MKMLKLLALALMTAAPMTVATTAEATCKWNCGNNGSTGGTLTGSLLSSNFAGADGDIAIATTENWKYEQGSINTVQDTDGPDRTVVKGKLAAGGSGMAAALSAGHGVQTAETIVSADLFMQLEAKTFEK